MDKFVGQMEWLALFVRNHQDSDMIISNGYLAQNEPVSQDLAVDFNVYQDKILPTIFLQRLNLDVSKRFTETDGSRMEALYNALCIDSLSASEFFETAVEHGLKTISWAE